MKRKFLSFLILAAVLFSSVSTAFANDENIDSILKETASYITENVKSPTIGSVGGDWAIIGLARSNVQIDEKYYDEYYSNVETIVKESAGVLHNRKYTEYSRVILSLTAIGKDPRNVGGYNLLVPLSDFEKTVWQGINGPVWALIALDSGNYLPPKNKDAKVQANRKMYVNYILERQNSDGGWALSENMASDIDVTAMVLQALSNYRHIKNVSTAIDKALALLQNSQNADGGFSVSGEATCESSAQVLAALCALGISYNSPEFTKNGKTVLDDILSYYTGKGFKHIKSGEENHMATEQAFYSLVALERFMSGKPSLYTMSEKSLNSGNTEVFHFEVQQAIEQLKRVENN